jgi:hypothetical protein
VSRYDGLGWLLFALVSIAWLVNWLGDTLGNWPRRGSNPPPFESACDDIIAEMHSLREKITWRMEELRAHVRPEPPRGPPPKPPTVVHITNHIRSRDDVA